MTTFRWGVAMKYVRRVHLYLGLLLYPWVLLYGLSGMLFNHPALGRDLSPTRFAPDRFEQLTGLSPWHPDAIAEHIVASLCARGGAYERVGAAELVGFPIFASPAADGGRHVLIMSLTSGRAGIAHHPPAHAHEPPPFAGPVAAPPYTLAALESALAPVLPSLGIDAPPLRAHPKVAPELHFQLEHDGRRWNVVYDLRSGTLSGRPSNAESGLSLLELLGKLHTQHHFPVHWGVSGYWALLADLTGLSLVLFALSGLFMWWQVKPSRRTGAIVIVASLALATAVMTGMASELAFLVEEPPAGP